MARRYALPPFFISSRDRSIHVALFSVGGPRYRLRNRRMTPLRRAAIADGRFRERASRQSTTRENSASEGGYAFPVYDADAFRAVQFKDAPVVFRAIGGASREFHRVPSFRVSSGTSAHDRDVANFHSSALTHDVRLSRKEETNKFARIYRENSTAAFRIRNIYGSDLH